MDKKFKLVLSFQKLFLLSHVENIALDKVVRLDIMLSGLSGFSNSSTFLGAQS